VAFISAQEVFTPKFICAGSMPASSARTRKSAISIFVQCSGTFLPCKIESLVFYVVFVISKKEAAEADVGASPLLFGSEDPGRVHRKWQIDHPMFHEWMSESAIERTI
jgi:hypothetical protein